MTSQPRPPSQSVVRCLQAFAGELRARGIRPCFCVGNQRAGTTALAAALGQTGRALVDTTKEPNLLTLNGRNGLWVKRHVKRVLQLIDEQPSIEVFADFSTTYSQLMTFPMVPLLLSNIFPDAYVLIIGRRPIERAKSAAIERLSHSRVVPGSALSLEQMIPNLVDGSLTHRTALAYIQRLGADRVVPLLFEALTDSDDDLTLAMAAWTGFEAAYDLKRAYTSNDVTVPPEVIRRMSATAGVGPLLDALSRSAAGPTLRAALRRFRQAPTADRNRKIQRQISHLIDPYVPVLLEDYARFESLCQSRDRRP